MSVIPLKADIRQRGLHVRLVPEADIANARRRDSSHRVKNGQVDIAGVRLVQKRASRVPKHGPPGYTSCDRGMISQSFW